MCLETLGKKKARQQLQEELLNHFKHALTVWIIFIDLSPTSFLHKPRERFLYQEE